MGGFSVRQEITCAVLERQSLQRTGKTFNDILIAATGRKKLWAAA